CLRQRIKKLFTAEKRMPWNLQDIFPAATARHDLDVYTWLVRETSERPWSGGAHPSATVVESVKLYRHTGGARDSVVICHLRHPACPNKTISLMFERFREGANPGEVAPKRSSSSGIALDSVIVTTTESDAKLITTSHLLYQTLNIHILQTNTPSISGRNRTYSVIDGACIFYGGAIYWALQRLFDGRSEDSPGCHSTLPVFLSMLDTYERKIQEVVVTFPAAKSQFEQMSANTHLNAIGARILTAQLPPGFRRQLEAKLTVLRNQKSAERPTMREKKHVSFSAESYQRSHSSHTGIEQ
ncbi:hypothetical protein B0H14DRAFT_3048704, partial [Mycena olivaceomarginata]